jgi:hypothetical protein
MPEILRLGTAPVRSENSIRRLVRALSENRGIIRRDACHPVRARNIRLRSIQVATAACLVSLQDERPDANASDQGDA